MDSLSQEQQSIQLSSYFRKIFSVIFILLLAGIASFAGYVAGLNRSPEQQAHAPTQQVPSPSPAKQPVQTAKEQLPTIKLSPTPLSNGFLHYKYLVPDIAFPIYQTDIPDTWSAYSIYGTLDNPTTTYFGDSHYKESEDAPFVMDVPSLVYVTFWKDHNLATKDPSTWSQTDIQKYYEAVPLSKTYTSITIDGIPARKFSFPSQGNDSTEVYFTKGDMIFAIVNVNGNGGEGYDHMLATFKVLGETP